MPANPYALTPLTPYGNETPEGGAYAMKGSVRYYQGRGWIVQYYDSKERKKIFKTFQKQNDAQLFWAHLNVQKSEGKLDSRDYAKGNPLGFKAQAERWLAYRKGELRSFRHARSHMDRAVHFFGERNIKEIGFSELEDFLQALPADLSAKTKANIFTTLHSFWNWLAKREKSKGFTVPDFPQIEFELGWRNTVTKEVQAAIIDEVKRIYYLINPKIWIGIKWLATYISIRPIELINIKEGDFDLGIGVVVVRHNKERKPKTVPLLDEDIALIQSFPKALPGVYFFRHGPRRGLPKAKRGRFSPNYLYECWKQACRNLRIEGVDLYGGTRHSSVRALRERFSPDQIKKATMHHTNEAFERYFQIELEDARKVYLHTSYIHENGVEEKAKVLKLRD